MSIKNPMFGLPSNILTGVDYYDATYHSDRAGFMASRRFTSTISVNRRWPATGSKPSGLLPTTDFSYGARIQDTILSARDRFDPNAP